MSLPEVDVGRHAVTAIYSGNNVFAQSTGGLTQTVIPASTQTSVFTDPSFSVYGDQVTFRALVVNATPNSAAAPTGSVQFFVDGKAFGAPQSSSLSQLPASPIRI